MQSSIEQLVSDTAARAEGYGAPFTPGQIRALEGAYRDGHLSRVMQQVETLSASIPNGKPVAYSGPLANGTRSQDAAGNYTKSVDGSYRIDETEVGRYLSDQATWAGAEDEINRRFIAAGEESLDDDQAFYIQEPAWRAASENFAEQARGPVAVFSSRPAEYSTFIRQELPIALNSPHIPAVNGIPTAELRQSADPGRQICEACDRAVREGRTVELGQFEPKQPEKSLGESGPAMSAPGMNGPGMSGPAMNGATPSGPAARAPAHEAELFTIAKEKARNPDAPITSLEATGKREVTGRVLGYTADGEAALFQRTNGSLHSLQTKDQAKLPVGREIDLDVKSQSVSRAGLTR